MKAPAATVHATALVIGEAGILIRGASGAGKSSLALALIASSAASGRFASLVGDDRIRLAAVAGRLVARPHPAITGLVERRGQGIVPMPYENASVVRCIVDLVPAEPGRDIPPRSPDESEARVEVGGVVVPRLAIAAGTSPEEGARRVVAFLSHV